MSSPRTIHTSRIRETVNQLIYEASFQLHSSTREAFTRMCNDEESSLARETLNILLQNDDIASRENIPLCQDCGAVTVFIDLGQQVCLEGDHLDESIQAGVADAYEKYYLRKSIVADPLQRVNTGTNTPAFVHLHMVPGNTLKITVYIKGGGSENMSALKMFRPTSTENDIIDYIVETVRDAGPNPCPPLFIGIGIGGTSDIAMLNSKKAVLRQPGSSHPVEYYNMLEKKILEAVNHTGVGPLGFGGKTTAVAVFIREAPAHIATLPVAVNLNCHSLRYRSAVL